MPAFKVLYKYHSCVFGKISGLSQALLTPMLFIQPFLRIQVLAEISKVPGIGMEGRGRGGGADLPLCCSASQEAGVQYRCPKKRFARVADSYKAGDGDKVSTGGLLGVPEAPVP